MAWSVASCYWVGYIHSQHRTWFSSHDFRLSGITLFMYSYLTSQLGAEDCVFAWIGFNPSGLEWRNGLHALVGSMAIHGIEPPTLAWWWRIEMWLKLFDIAMRISCIRCRELTNYATVVAPPTIGSDNMGIMQDEKVKRKDIIIVNTWPYPLQPTLPHLLIGQPHTFLLHNTNSKS